MPRSLELLLLAEEGQTISKGVSMSCGELLYRTGFNQPYHGEISVQFMQDFPSTKVGLSSAGMTAVQARGGFEWSPLEGGYRNLLSKCGHWRQVTNFCPKCSLQRRFC